MRRIIGLSCNLCVRRTKKREKKEHHVRALKTPRIEKVGGEKGLKTAVHMCVYFESGEIVFKETGK